METNTRAGPITTGCVQEASELLWLGQGKRVQISFPDPAEADGTDEQVMAVFCQVRDDIEDQVLGYLRNWQGGLKDNNRAE